MTDETATAPDEAKPQVRPPRLLRGWWERARRFGIVRLGVVGLLALVLGIAIGRGTAPSGDADARRAVETAVIPLVLDADGIWTSASDDRPPVSEALVLLRRDGDATAVERSLEDWLNAYDAVLVQLAGRDLPPSARPVQRQFITAVTLSRDAVEVLGYAARVEDEEVRRHLLAEVGRLRQRGEQLTQAARASSLDLDRQRTDMSPLPPVTSFEEGLGD